MSRCGHDEARLQSFRRLPGASDRVTIQVNGQPLAACSGDTVASALLASGLSAFARNAATGAAQAPLCLIGICFGCLCEVDGRPGVQACLVPVREGMQVRTDLAVASGGQRP